MVTVRASLAPADRFVNRHIGPSPDETRGMLATLGYASLDAFIDAVVPEDIRLRRALALPPGRTEREVLQALRGLAAQNQLYRSYIGMGYYHSFTPQVIQRNIVENPGWYTAYTPYQPEIAQGRLEALLNFQTMVADLTALPIANASLLDEATAAAEAMNLTEAVAKVPPGTTPMFMIAEGCHPQTIAVVRTRAEARGVQTVIADPAGFEFRPGVIGALLQYPTTEGKIEDYRAFCDKAHAAGALVTVATDLLALTVLVPPGEWGADIAVGNSQRFGVPMGYGGPHAAFFATREAHRRHVPGRIIGVSRDAAGRPALRMALQTREQHIRREKATSNICTAQVLLAVMASMYAVYHGPEGLRRIAERVHTLAVLLAQAVTRLGIPLDEATALGDLADLVTAFSLNEVLPFMVEDLGAKADPSIPESLHRTSSYLTHPVFHRYRSETEMLRYIKRLEGRDLSLTSAMIPLGSCTMKLNATTEMVPLSWREFNRLHPFAPREQATGYRTLFRQLEDMLAEITGFPKVSLQPNSGAQGEFTGLLVIRAYHRSRGEGHRTTCLIPTSAHGTNPASAVMAGLRVVPVQADAQPGHHGARGVRPMRRCRNQTGSAVPFTTRAVIGPDHEQSGELALRPRVRLQRDFREACDLRQHILELAEQRAVAGGLFPRRKRVQPIELAPRQRDHLGGGVELHRARAERDHSRCERQVAPFEPLDVAQHLRLGAVAMEHRVRQVGRGAVQRLGD